MSAAALILSASGFVSSASAQAADVENAITDVNIEQSSVDQYSSFRLNLKWAVPDSANPGDTFSLTLPKELLAVNGTTFTLNAPSGETVARAQVRDGVVTFTLTDYVSGHVAVKGSAWFYVQLARNASPGQQLHLEFVTEGSTFVDNLGVTGTPQDYSSAATKWMTWADPARNNPRRPAQDKLLWSIVAPRVNADTVGGTVTFIDEPGVGSKIDCNTILGFWGTKNTGAANVTGFIGPDRYTKKCSPERLELVLTTRSDDLGKIPYILGWSAIESTPQEVYRNTARVLVDRGGSYSVSDTALYGGGGVGEGVVPTATPTATGTPTTVAPTTAPPTTTGPATTPPATGTPTTTVPPTTTAPATPVPTTTTTPPTGTSTTSTPPVASGTTPPQTSTGTSTTSTPPVASGTTPPQTSTGTSTTSTPPVASGTTPAQTSTTSTPPVARASNTPRASTPARINTGEPAAGSRNGWLIAGGAALVGAAGIGLVAFGRGKRGRR